LFLPRSEIAAAPRLGQSGDYEAAGDVASTIDYYNIVLVGLSASTVASLQRVQNAAVRLILRLDRRSHITSALRELHFTGCR